MYVQYAIMYIQYRKGTQGMSFLDSIKAVPVTDLAQRMGYSLVKKGRYYSLKEHDSVIIDTTKNCFWRNSRFSQGFKGGAGSTIDFVMEFGGEPDYKAAMRRIALMYGIEGDKPPSVAYQRPEPPQTGNKPQTKKTYPKTLVLPKHAHKEKNETVYPYLLSRGISHSVIRYFLARKMLYEDNHRNCVFVSPKQDFGCIRSTGETRFLTDVEGSDYRKCFFFKGVNAKKLYVAESVIDIMSVMTYLQIRSERSNEQPERENWYGNHAYLALSGTNKIQSLFYHISQEPDIREVYLCLDRDEAGRIADEKAVEGLKNMGFRGVCRILKAPDEQCKDWNDFVKSLL